MSTDNYASEEETRALLRKDTRTPAEKRLDRMLEDRGASEQGAEPSLILRQIALDLLAEQPANQLDDIDVVDMPAQPQDLVPLRMEWEPGYPEDVAFGTQRQMDRLKKWLDKYFALIQRQAQPQQEPVALLNAISAEPTEMIHKWRVIDIIQSFPPQGIYYTPQPAHRKPLTAEQIESLWDHGMYVHCGGITALRAITRAIEAAHGIKEQP